LLPLSAAVGGVALDLARIDPWGKIAPGLVDDAVRHRDLAGWHGCLHEGIVYVNVPQAAGRLSKQWVLNTRNGSWQVFTSWNGSSFASFGGELYFGAETGGRVNEVGGGSDDDDDITALASGAFVTPNNSFKSNIFTMIRPKVEASGVVSGMVGVDTDFVLRSAVTPSVDIATNENATPWGSPWGSPWGHASASEATWFTITGEGRSVSARLRVTATSTDLKWFASDILFKPGGSK
jgi:hypothetical protein